MHGTGHVHGHQWSRASCIGLARQEPYHPRLLLTTRSRTHSQAFTTRLWASAPTHRLQRPFDVEHARLIPYLDTTLSTHHPTPITTDDSCLHPTLIEIPISSDRSCVSSAHLAAPQRSSFRSILSLTVSSKYFLSFPRVCIYSSSSSIPNGEMHTPPRTSNP